MAYCHARHALWLTHGSPFVLEHSENQCQPLQESNWSSLEDPVGV